MVLIQSNIRGVREFFIVFLISVGINFVIGEVFSIENRIENIYKVREKIENREVVYISEKGGKEIERLGLQIKPVKIDLSYKKPYSLVLAKWYEVKERQKVSFPIERRYSTSLPYGAVKVEPGKSGEIEILWREYRRGSIVLDRKKVKVTMISQARPQIEYIGRGYMLASRGEFAGKPYLDMIATGYDPGPISCGPYASGYTSIGLKAGYGVVAVDPTVIPLGKRLYIEGYGYAIAGDVGRAIRGLRVDLGFDTYREAINFGVRRVRVYILN
ncbi:MAG: 3D domain-containing protein [bacterium]